MKENDEDFPKVVTNLEHWLLFERAEGNIYCIGNINLDQYVKVSQNQLSPTLNIIKEFDGKHSVLELKEKFGNLVNVESLVTALKKAGLIIDSEYIKDKNELEQLSFNIASISIDNCYHFLNKIGNFLISKVSVLLLLSFCLLSLLFFAKDIWAIMVSPSSYLVTKSEILNIFLYLAVTVLSTLLHELAHAITAAKWGIKPTILNISLYLYYSPMIYLKLPGLYTISRKKRIAVWSAGIFLNLFLAALSLWAHYFYQNVIFLLISVVNFTFIVINLFPFLSLDGYFIMETLLKEVNLRPKMLQLLKGKKIDNNNLLTKCYVYISLIVMALLVISQILWLSTYIQEAVVKSTKITEFFYNIRLFLLLLLSLGISKLVRRRNKV